VFRLAIKTQWIPVLLLLLLLLLLVSATVMMVFNVIAMVVYLSVLPLIANERVVMTLVMPFVTFISLRSSYTVTGATGRTWLAEKS